MHETSTGGEFPAPHGRILIVDADPAAREKLSDSVVDLGHTVCHAAEPGPAAFDVPGAARPDVALIGLAAGDEAGPAVRTGEQIARRFGVPLVYATETMDAESLDLAQRTDPHGCVLKSGDPRQLGLVLRAALRTTVRKPSDGQDANPGDAAPRPEWNSAILEGLFDNMSDAVIVADDARPVRGRERGRATAQRDVRPVESRAVVPALRGLPGGRADAVPGGGSAAHRRDPRKVCRRRAAAAAASARGCGNGGPLAERQRVPVARCGRPGAWAAPIVLRERHGRSRSNRRG